LRGYRFPGVTEERPLRGHLVESVDCFRVIRGGNPRRGEDGGIDGSEPGRPVLAQDASEKCEKSAEIAIGDLAVGRVGATSKEF